MGQTLGATSVPRELGPVGAGGARIPRIPQRIQKQKQKQAKKERSPSPDWGVDDDDVVMIDSD
jgi:ubiquitin fusion degradation protein 1